MTHPQKAKHLTLERLEPRDCPALDVFYAGGSLFILGRPASNSFLPGEGLNITVTSATGAVTVAETDNFGNPVANYGTYIVRNNLYIGLTNYDTNINVDTDGHRLYANLFINLGLGDLTPLPINLNPINIYSSDPTNPGSIAGNVTVFHGSGFEYLSVGANAELGPAGPTFEIDGNLNVNFPQTIDDEPSSNGDSLVVSGPTDIRGNVNTNGVDNVDVGTTFADESITIAGNLTINNALALNHTEALIYGSVNGNVSVVGSATSSDSNPNRVDIGTSIVPVVIGGNVTLDQTEGSSSFSFAPGSIIEGNLSYAGVIGDDTTTLNGAVLGSAVLTLGNGNNQASADDSASFSGNLQLTAGNGANDFSALSPSIQGNLNITLGSGDNTLGFTGIMNGGTLTSNTGNGTDSIAINADPSTGPFALTAHLGSGANNLAFDADPLTQTDIEFAPHVATDTLTQTGVISGPYTLVNYP